MKNLSYFFVLCFLIPMSTIGQSTYKKLEVKPNQISEFTGNLSEGAIIQDLSWASTSSNACWPGTQNSKFRGNHVLYQFEIPPYSEVTVKVIPNDKRANFSLYGYQVGTTNFSTPPNLASCVSCEADHKWDYPKRGKTQDHTRSVFFNSIKNPYNVFIGVVGGDKQAEGKFTLQVDLKSKVTNTAAQEPLKIYKVQIEKDKVMSFDGDLSSGTKIHDLSWASNSSVACFPGTQNAKFRGNHIFYVTEIPSYSDMEITVIPDDKKHDMSIYAYQDGTTSQAFPLNLSSCVSCEAEHKWDYPKRGKTQDHTRTVFLNSVRNPYRVVIGVAGSNGLTEGSFKLRIKTTSKQ